MNNEFLILTYCGGAPLLYFNYNLNYLIKFYLPSFEVPKILFAYLHIQHVVHFYCRCAK